MGKTYNVIAAILVMAVWILVIGFTCFLFHRTVPKTPTAKLKWVKDKSPADDAEADTRPMYEQSEDVA